MGPWVLINARWYKVSAYGLASWPSPYVESDFETQGNLKSTHTKIIPL